MFFIKSLSVFVFLSLGINSFAGEWSKYTEEAFHKAKNDGKTVVLDFHASWCSTCRKQKPILEALTGQEEFKDVVGLVADFDKEEQLKKKLQIIKQSTLVVFKGHKEMDRKMGLTSEEDIANLLRRGLK